MITDNLIGLIIGLIVALILVITMHYTIFRDKNMTIFYVIFFIICGTCGLLIQNKYFSVQALEAPTPQDQIEEIDKTISDNWKNTNGGFTFEEIKIAQSDDACPSFEDQIIKLNCYDFGTYICFSYQKGDVYQNIIFYKAEDGLILDGVINMTADVPGIKWFLAIDYNTFTWIDGRDVAPSYFREESYGKHNYDNLVSVSRQSAFFLRYSIGLRTNKSSLNYEVMKRAAEFTATNATSHFIKFNDIELIGTANTGFVKINSFYNYLYEQIKGQDYNTTKLIDATNCLCLPIPQELQKNYPIPQDKQAEYDGKQYYGVYQTNIAVDLTFIKGNKEISNTSNNQDYVDTIKEDEKTKDKVVVENVEPNYIFSTLKINFVDTKNSDLTNVDLKLNPVRITLTNNELNKTKTITIDSFTKLYSGINVLLNSNTNWSFYIDSESLIFEDFKGSFTIQSIRNLVTFNYYYLNNYTIASVGLNPIGTIDTNVIDLQTNPVKIVLSNSEHTYQFVFDSNSKLKEYESMLVELGDYDYTILSKQLIFASVTGKLTITTKDKIMLFNYALNVDDGALDFTINISNTGSTNNQFNLYSASSNVDFIRENLSANKVYLVTCVIYDKDGKLMETFSHTHQSTGSCADTWYASNLVAGQEYTLQLRFTDRDDSTITYLSDILTFTFNSNTSYKISYTVTQN